MKKLIAWYRRIPRRVRIVRNLLLAAVLLCLFYIFAGCPDMTAEQGYQRALRRSLLGPGEVVGILNVDVNGGYNRLLLGETGEGVTLYCYRHENLGFLKGNTFSSWEGTLVYREKGETVTVVAAPGVDCTAYQEEIHAPIILFDECPKAVRAELNMRLTGTYDSEDYEFAYSLEAAREAGGYFVFDLSAQGNKQAYWTEGFAIERLSRLYWDTGGRANEYPAVVRLYDRNNALIYEETLFFRSSFGEAHAKREAENA